MLLEDALGKVKMRAFKVGDKVYHNDPNDWYTINSFYKVDGKCLMHLKETFGGFCGTFWSKVQ